jgi:exodeoxyribonuclease-1
MAQFEAFYDTETTGPNPTFDQVLQKAAILTDDDFVAIETFDVRSRLARWMVPTPGALKVTHLDPNEIARAPHSAFEFARLMHATFSNWASRGPIDFSGWNTLSYDEEIVRRMFYMNLLDPYVTSGKGKRRVDYLLMTRALAARNPDILVIPRHAHNDKPNFKLENIATANGFEGHNAHDALGDVWATIHMAKLIRDLDPSLFAHVKAMGSANDAMSFVEDERIFRLLGGPMIEPGILDVCLIASDPNNPKAKKAWNLAVDPTPFLDMSTEEILDAMKKSGTPFRSVKCHKSPLVFPTGWEFLRHASKTDAPTPDLIDARSKLVLENTGFRQRVAEAMRLQTEGYEPNTHLEEKIYDGFPSWADKDAMKSFHNASTWERRLIIARAFEKTELQQIGVRLVWANAPECLSEQHRTLIDAHVGATRFGLLTGQPWTTVGSFMEELDEWDAKLPGDPELAVIRAWALETFPEAAKWVPKPKEVDGEAAAPDVVDAGPVVDSDHVDPAIEDAPTVAVPAGPAPHFLDGID